MSEQPDEFKEIVAMVGQATLFKRSDGKYELTGGSEADRGEIKDWMAMHLKDAQLMRQAGHDA